MSSSSPSPISPTLETRGADGGQNNKTQWTSHDLEVRSLVSRSVVTVKLGFPRVVSQCCPFLNSR